MRKRLLRGAIAAAVIGVGVAACVLSPPRKGTVEYHQGQFRKIYNDGRAGRVGQLILDHAPHRLKVAYMRNRWKRLNFHRGALVAHGYLVEKIFIVSFRPAPEVANRLQTAVHDMFAYSHDGFSYGAVNALTTNTLVVIDIPKRMERWSNVVASIDVPEGAQ